MSLEQVQKSSGKFQSFDGTEIYYEERGEGTPLIFVYGIACLMNHWHHQIDYFSKTNRVITFDLRGHHLSGTPSDLSHLKVEDMAQDVLVLMAHLQISKAHFFGHSFGVPVLVKAYDLNPSLFQTMTLINGFVENPIRGMFGLPNLEMAFQFLKTQYSLAPELWNTLWKKAINNPISMFMSGVLGGFNLNLTEFKNIEIYARGVANMDLGVFLNTFEGMMDFEGTSILSKINIPTLVIAGEKDMVTPEAKQIKLKDHIKNSEYLLVPYGSHCTQLDFPDYLNLRIEKFLLLHK